MKKIIKNGIVKYDNEDGRTIFDMREANPYTYPETKVNDIVIHTNEIVYVINDKGSYKKMNKSQIESVFVDL